MVEVIYIEDAVADHPRVREICRRLPAASRVPCTRYGEIFNRRAQNFRLQKRRPALILAHKLGKFVLEAPEGYGIGGRRNYYFSHMLNCVYDCRYCFLQGMFRSAHYLLFVNYEDFQQEIADVTRQAPAEETFYFSGYDCDSLAFEPVTHFADSFLPFFDSLKGAWIELRTKSVQIKSLLEREPLPKCVVAFSMTPDAVGSALEKKVPPLARRLEAMARLDAAGWKLGLRFDPLIYSDDFREQYRELFAAVFSRLRLESIHSVSLGPFRLPRDYFKNMHRMFPDEPLLAGPLEERDGMVSYPRGLEEETVGFCTEELRRHVPKELFFPCTL